jgi:hypothetical protein
MSNVPKTKRVHDPQCEALYGWESSWHAWNINTLSINACRKIIRRACLWYKVEKPRVIHHGTKELSYSVPEVGFISVQGGEQHKCGGRNIATALHEAAHHIGWHLHGENIQDHGPTFLRIYMDLLERAQVAPRVALEATARAHKLKWK